MNNLQKWGGWAAIIEAITYIVGFAMVFTVLAPLLNELNPAEYVAFLTENRVLMVVWHQIIYVLNGVFLVVLVLALHEMLKDKAPGLSQTAAIFGYIWAGLILASGMMIITNIGTVVDLAATSVAEAEAAFVVFSSVEGGIGGSVEVVGGVWILLASWAALKVGALNKPLNILGLIIGISGIVTVAPVLYEAGTVFGLGFIIWFAWAGVVMLRQDTRANIASAQSAAYGD
ncbi:MAG: DUF4386 family protein [Chloroflexota bacterium]